MSVQQKLKLQDFEVALIKLYKLLDLQSIRLEHVSGTSYNLYSTDLEHVTQELMLHEEVLPDGRGFQNSQNRFFGIFYSCENEKFVVLLSNSNKHLVSLICIILGGLQFTFIPEPWGSTAVFDTISKNKLMFLINKALEDSSKNESFGV